MQLRVRALVAAAEGFGVSPLLPAAAVALIAIFSVSLALAEPRDPSQLMAVRGDTDVGATIRTMENGKALASDALTERETAIFSAPLPAPHYHDRYRFYHRYDRYSPRSRFQALDDGVN